MKGKQSPPRIRAVGQRRLLFRPHPSIPSESNHKTVSFSDYLNRKLNRSHSTLPSAFPPPQPKHTPFIQDSLFKLFNHPAPHPNCNNLAAGDERSNVPSRLLILGGDADNNRPKQSCMQPAMKKRLVVLGDDPKPKRGTHGQNSCSSKQSKPQYNHYENGGGWWDYEREGVDNDEVGTNQVWEGMGTTTLGEIVDWH